MQSLQDQGEPAARRYPQAARYADLETGSLTEMPIMSKKSLRTAGAHEGWFYWPLGRVAGRCAIDLGCHH
jgi:hypothetical protein